MFEFLDDVMPEWTEEVDHPNSRFSVSEKFIEQAESRMGRRFPEQLRTFFEEVGCGNLKASPTDDPKGVFNHFNRFLSPNEVADLFLGEDEYHRPDDGFRPGLMRFFEVNEERFLVVQTTDPEGAVVRSDGTVISKDLVTFTKELAENPSFFDE